jgi:proteasome lid subunit RPN8/RPN11
MQAQTNLILSYLRLSSQHVCKLREAYEGALPRECCGVLLGDLARRGAAVREVLSTLNAVSTPGGFAIPDHELEWVRSVAVRAQLSIIALFHSHPDGSSELSESDRVALRHSEWPWVILTQDPKTRDVQLRLYHERAVRD